MANTDDKPALKITLEDLDKVILPQEAQPAVRGAAAAAGAGRQYGSIAMAGQEAPAIEESKGSILLQGWFYLGVAGFLGALVGWGIGEPFFHDDDTHALGDRALIPLVVAFICLGLGVAESIVERSPRKAAGRGLLALGAGAVGGLVFDFVANIIFVIAISVVAEMGVQTYRNPAFWIARGVAWMVFGVAGGIVYGLVGRSGKKMRYGILGGMIGAGLGGIVFDPISMATNRGGPSRAVGFALLGLATGAAMGIVESALKDRWLYVASGPLAGKQFILYKPVTVIGSSQQCDIYLFKDNTIQPQHASIELRGAQTFLHAQGQAFVSGQPARHRALQTGDLIQIGRYAFHFRERHRN
jgi:Inner membrane component of T3SS, cytoplasmic domain